MLVGGGLSLLRRLPVVTDMYVMRVLSAILGVLTLWTAWLGARLVFGEALAMTIVAVLAVHPQFVIASTAAGPDAVVNLAGGLIWWQTAEALHRPTSMWSLVALWIAAIGAAAVDRMGVSLLGSALLVSMFIVMRRYGLRSRIMLCILIGAAIVGVGVRLNDDVWHGVGDTLHTALLPVPDARSWNYVWLFHSSLFEGWWLTLGWAEYPPPDWWVLGALGISVIAAIGVFRSVIERRVPDAIAIAILMVAIQLVAVDWVYFRPAVGAQGRHLFPVLIPSLVLLCAGWDRLLAPSLGSRARVALVLVVAALDTAGWLTLAIPVYGRG